MSCVLAKAFHTETSCIRKYVTAKNRVAISRPAFLIWICLLQVTSNDLQGESKTKLAAGVKPLAGGGGIFKSAAVEVLRRERRLMTTGDITKYAASLFYHWPSAYTNLRFPFSHSLYCFGIAHINFGKTHVKLQTLTDSLDLQSKQSCLT